MYINYDSVTLIPKFAFLTFRQASDASLALNHKSHYCDGVKLDVRPYINRNSSSSTATSKTDNDHKDKGDNEKEISKESRKVEVCCCFHYNYYKFSF